MSDKDFIIVDGVLTEYVGCGGDIIIPDGVKIINENAFVNPETITGISLPKSFTGVNHNKSIKRVIFPDYRFLYSLSNLKQISVEKGNTIYSVIDGALINMETKELVAYPPARENSSYVTPEWIKDIHFNAFGNNRFLQKITISEVNVGFEHGVCLGGCDNLTTLVLPRSFCTGFLNPDFSSKSIKQVFYKGCYAEERKSSIYSSGFGGISYDGDEILPDATWFYYSEKRPKDKGNYWHYGADGITIIIWNNNEEVK